MLKIEIRAWSKPDAFRWSLIGEHDRVRCRFLLSKVDVDSLAAPEEADDSSKGRDGNGSREIPPEAHSASYQRDPVRESELERVAQALSVCSQPRADE